VNSDPFLVIAAEKHDAGSAFPSFAGWVDEVRLSNVLRYSGPTYALPDAPFMTDAATVALYHLDEGIGDLILDASGAPGGPSHGERRYGGTPPGPEWSDENPFDPVVSVAPDAAPPVRALAIWPNPARGIVRIRPPSAPVSRSTFIGAAPIRIVDAAGRRVGEVCGAESVGTFEWDARGVPAGVYFVVAGVAAVKLVVE
jgi:hypothetical protein